MIRQSTYRPLIRRADDQSSSKRREVRESVSQSSSVPVHIDDLGDEVSNLALSENQYYQYKPPTYRKNVAILRSAYGGCRSLEADSW